MREDIAVIEIEVCSKLKRIDKLERLMEIR